MKIISLWIDFHHTKGLGKIYQFEYQAEEIPTGLLITPLDKNGNIDGKSRRMNGFGEYLKPNYMNNDLFSVSGKVWCKPEQLEEAKEVLLEGLKEYGQKIIDDYCIRITNFKTKLNEI